MQQDLGKYTVFEKDMSTLFILSAAIALLMMSGPLLLLSNFLQPVQASSIGSSSSVAMTFRATEPATGEIGYTSPTSPCEATLTFHAQGTNNSSTAQPMNGTFQITSSHGGEILASGKILKGLYSNGNEGARIEMAAQVGNASRSQDCAPQETSVFDIIAQCGTSETKEIDLAEYAGKFYGSVECSSSHEGGGNTATHTTTQQQQQSSSSSPPPPMTASSQDSNGESRDGDGDGIPDSSDRCTHNSNPRCFKEDTIQHVLQF
jgi:hypothetical protein